MQITLEQAEIVQAVEAFVRTQINIAPNQEVNMTFTAGRGDNGLTAALQISAAAIASNAGQEVYRTTTASQVVGSKAIAEEPKAAPKAKAEPILDYIEADEPDTSPIDVNADDEEDTPPPAKAKKSPFSKVYDEADDDNDGDEEQEAKPAKKSSKSIFSKAS